MVAVECPTCRLTESVPAAEMLAEMLEPAGDEQTSAARICWICATCSGLAMVEVSGGLLAVLMAAGMTMLETESGEPDLHPERPAPGAPLTADDLLELHERLCGDSWFDELRSLDPPPAVA